MSALIRRYPCLYTSEAHKHPRNRRQLDGFVTIHHYNASAVLWSESDRQLKWTLLSRSELKRRNFEQASGVSEEYRLVEDEEVVFGGGYVATVSGDCMHESQQDFSQLAAAKSRKRAESAAWRAEALQEDKPPEEKKKAKLNTPSSSSKLPSGQGVKTKGTPAKVRWRQSRGSMIGVSPKLQPPATSTPKESKQESSASSAGQAQEGPASLRSRSSSMSSASALPPHLRKSCASSSVMPSASSHQGHSLGSSPQLSRISVDSVSPKLLRPFKAPSRKSL